METFLGPAGVGDLFATAASGLSRNYRLGRALGQGQTFEQALLDLGQVAEGAPTSHAAQMLARTYEVDMPVFAAVSAVLNGRVQPAQAVGMLMERTSSMGDFI
jgi:glycerol-3-phosphate dehydrogenase (NAD(P)+)